MRIDQEEVMKMVNGLSRPMFMLWDLAGRPTLERISKTTGFSIANVRNKMLREDLGLFGALLRMAGREDPTILEWAADILEDQGYWAAASDCQAASREIEKGLDDEIERRCPTLSRIKTTKEEVES